MNTHDLLSLVATKPVALGLDAAGLILFGAYHLHLARVFRREPLRTYHGYSNSLRRAWVETIRAHGIDVLGVQTLRNWVMSATLLGSTSILIGLGVAHVAFTGLDIVPLATALSPFPPPDETLIRVKLLVLAVIFFASFRDFVLALRYYNHTGFLINLTDAQIPGSPVDAVSATLNRASGHYNRGTRKLLFAAPFALWLIGPLWLLAGVLVSILTLYRFDLRDSAHADEVPGGG